MEKQVSSQTPPSTPKKGQTSGQTCVVVPTTGGLVWVRGLKKRPRLKSSYAIMDGDFRPLKLSKDYHYFVTGPLMLINDEAQVFELSLSDNIDSGRSWEFPTLVAHLLEKRETLAFPNVATLEKSGDPGFDVVWATGMLDPDLSPVAGDYMLERKLELSRPLFKICTKYGRSLRIFLSSELPSKERALFKQAAEEFGGEYNEISSLTDLSKILSVDGSPTLEKKSAHSTDRSPTVSQQKPVKQAPNRPWLAYGAITSLLVALTIWIGFSFFGPDSSTLLTGPENSIWSNSLPFTVERLTAMDQSDCRKRIMMAKRFDRQPLSSRDGTTFHLSTHKGLCGLRFRNTGGTTFRLQLSKALEGYAIIGNSSLFRGRDLPAGKYTDLYLSRLPADLRAQLILTMEGASTSRFQIEFTRSAPDG